ncbi:hypothetical protein PoB_005086600, partial [Plakobranchus ocellatus]
IIGGFTEDTEQTNLRSTHISADANSVEVTEVMQSPSLRETEPIMDQAHERRRRPPVPLPRSTSLSERHLIKNKRRRRPPVPPLRSTSLSERHFMKSKKSSTEEASGVGAEHDSFMARKVADYIDGPVVETLTENSSQRRRPPMPLPRSTSLSERHLKKNKRSSTEEASGVGAEGDSFMNRKVADHIDGPTVETLTENSSQ